MQGDASYIPRKSRRAIRLNDHLGVLRVMWCSAMPARWGQRGLCPKRLGSRYRSGRSPDWVKFKNPEAPVVRREAEEDWG